MGDRLGVRGRWYIRGDDSDLVKGENTAIPSLNIDFVYDILATFAGSLDGSSPSRHQGRI